MALGVWIKSPIGNNSQAVAVQYKVMGGREGLYPVVVGIGSAADPAQAQAQVGLVHIEFFGKARTLFERLDLRRKRERSVGLFLVDKGLDSKAISGAKELVFAVVPNR